MNRSSRKEPIWAVVLSMFLVLAAIGIAMWAPDAFSQEKKKLKVAAMLGSPVEQQWVGRVHDALVAAQKRGDIDYQLSENVEDADMIRVLREYAEQGVDLIVGEVYPVEREARQVAKDYPNVAFLLGSSLKPQEPNFAVYDNWNQDASYLGGLIAGSITKSNTVGVVGAYPIPEINRLAGAFKQGVCEVNPKAKVLVNYIGSFYDPPKEKEAGIALIDSGADVLYAERFGAIAAAKDRNIPAISNLTHYEQQFRDTVITSTLWHAEPFIDAAIDQVRKGQFKAIDYGEKFGLMKDGGASLADLGPWEQKLPKQVLDLVRQREKEILDGKFQATIVPNEVKSGGC
jgi:basic membrane lipoprotein Med (substrate-binding protein (PBP1-ABC) superfamily)